MASKTTLTAEDIKQNITSIKDWLDQNTVDSFYISSFDEWLNEYVPLENCPRYYVTGFSGSVAEVLIVKGKKVHLYVDGRYHQQADEEVDHDLVQVVKCEYGVSNRDQLKKHLVEYKCKSLSLVDSRSYFNSLDFFSSVVEKLTTVSENKICTLIPLKTPQDEIRIEKVSTALTGMSTEEKLSRILKDGEGIFLSQLDSISWLTNSRGYQLPYQSAVVAKALATKDEVKFIGNGYESTIPKIDLNKVYYDPNNISVADFKALEKLYKNIEAKPDGILMNHAFKNASEIKSMEESFKRGDQAIYKTMKWIRERYNLDEKFSELDFYRCAEVNYQATGVMSQSFHTIAGIGANSSIIHFGDSSDDVEVSEGDLLLLDSGGYWESGYATDTTRVGVYAKEGDSKQKKLYTLVLIGLLRAQNAIFKKGTLGKEIDALARGALKEHDLDYAHGTGHGVGINVHESGYSITPHSEVPLHAGLVGSIEPGVYLPGYGGIRLENIVAVEEDPKNPGMLMFRPLVFIGFEPKLIDYTLLSEQEKSWLDEYEKSCKDAGTSFL